MPPAKEWDSIRAAFADGRTFTIADAGEAIRPVVNPMVAARKAAMHRRSASERLTTTSYESRSLDDVTAGLRAITRTLIGNRLGLQGCRPLVERVGRGLYRLHPRATEVEQ